jgi:hypothetical protein
MNVARERVEWHLHLMSMGIERLSVAGIWGSAWRGIACCIAIAGCSADDDGRGGAPASGSKTPVTDDAAAPSLCPSCSSTEPVALGGETQEFDGGRTVYRILSSTPRPLSDPELAPLLARVEGVHDLTFRWRESFLESGIGGYDEVTRIVLDVRALRAFDVQLDSAEHPSTVHIELAVDLSTADGALRGSVVHRVDAHSVLVPAGSADIITDDGGAYPLQDFRGSLDLALDPGREVAAVLSVELLFSDRGVRGRLVSFVRYPPDRSRRVLVGAFPDDGCDVQEWPVLLDATPTAFEGHSLLESFEAVAAALNQGPLRPPTGPARADLTLEVGAAGHACQYWPSVASVHAPIRLQSGSVDLRAEVRIELKPNQLGGLPQAQLSTAPQFVPAERLYSLTGIPLGDIPTSADVAPVIQTTFTETGGFVGALALDVFAGNERSGRSWLGWCEGDGCY